MPAPSIQNPASSIRRIAALFLLTLTLTFSFTLRSSASAGVDKLLITEVRPSTGEVEVTHTGTESLTVPEDLSFRHDGNGPDGITAGTEFAAGESIVFSMDIGTTGGEVWLFTEPAFTDPDAILSGVVYGAPSTSPEVSTAVAAGVWSSEEAFVPAPNDADSLRLNAMDPSLPENWVIGEPLPGQFFGTGEIIEQAIADRIETGDITIELEPVVDGLVGPLALHEPRDDSGRLFILDQIGVVHVVQNGELLAEPLLDVTGRLVSLRDEGYEDRGFLGFVLHPEFPETPKVYTHTSEPVDGEADFQVPNPDEITMDHQSVIAEWQIDSQNPNTIDPESRRELMRIDQPNRIHQGGTLAFGPDGNFYIALGDGGGHHDFGPGRGPKGNGQDTETVLGSILRIDLDGNDSANGQYGIPPDNPLAESHEGLGEIYAYGLRNPYVFSFDRETGEMYIADVGQNDIEALYRGVKGGNYGWRITEGSFFFRPDPEGRWNGGRVVTVPEEPLPSEMIDPIAEYENPDDGQAVIGGFVYRGSAIPYLDGRYIFGDWGTYRDPAGKLFYLDNEDKIQELIIGQDDRELDLWVTGFGEDAAGEIYVLGSLTMGLGGTTGKVYRLTAVPEAILAITNMAREGGMFRIEFASSRPAENHIVESRPTLSDEDQWAPLPGVAPEEISPGQFRIEVPVTDAPRHFYRIKPTDGTD